MNGMELFLSISIIGTPILTLFFLAITGEDLNDKLECQKCKMISRKGIWDLRNINIDRDIYPRKQFCPHCEELTSCEETFKYAPFAKRINMVNCFKITKMIRNGERNNQANQQVDAYLRVQQSKIDKMIGEK